MDGCITSFPDHIIELIFSHLDLYTLGNCLLVCKKWYRFLNSDENNEIWRVQCRKKLTEETISSDLLSTVPSYKAKLKAHFYAWNPNDCSRNIYTKFNDLTLHRLDPTHSDSLYSTHSSTRAFSFLMPLRAPAHKLARLCVTSAL
jgi:F-box protein 45